jgi:Domain of unknown function (DUF1990)
VFRFNRHTAAAIEKRIAASANIGSSAPSLLTLREPFRRVARLPWGFAHDFRRSKIGQSGNAWARLAFERWAMFDLGWVRVANLQAPIATGQIVAVEAETLGLYRLSSESPVLQGERDSQGKATGVAPHQAGDHKARSVEKDRRLRELPALTK